MLCIPPSLQETCPNNAESRQPPNTHKPLSGVHEENINPPLKKKPSVQHTWRHAAISSTWLYYLFSKDGAISLHGVCERRGTKSVDRRTARD